MLSPKKEPKLSNFKFNKSLKSYTENLNNEILCLKKENSDLRVMVTSIKILENKLKISESRVRQLEIKNDELVQEKLDLEKKCLARIHQVIKEKEQALLKYDQNMTMFDQKISVVHQIELDNQVFKEEVQKLKDQNNKLKESTRIKKEQLELQNQINFGQLKKKVTENLNNLKKNVSRLNLEHMDINNKLILLQNHKLLSELEYQKQELGILTDEKKKLKKKIIELEKENDINQIVQIKLASKLNQINIASAKSLSADKSNIDLMPSIIPEDERNFNLTCYNKTKSLDSKKKLSKNKKFNNGNNTCDSFFIINKYNKSNYNSNNVNNCTCDETKNTQNEEITKNKTIEKRNLSSKNEKICIENNDTNTLGTSAYIYKKYIKMINKKNYEIENLKIKIDHLKNRLSYFVEKYKGVFNFLEDAIHNFYNDKELNSKSFNINIEKIKKNDFESFTKEEKYHILVLLMKYLLPFVTYNFNKNYDFGNNIFNTNLNLTNYSFNKTRTYLNDKSLKKAFLAKDNKLQKDLHMVSDNYIFSNSIPMLRKFCFSNEPKLKNKKYRILVD